VLPTLYADTFAALVSVGASPASVMTREFSGAAAVNPATPERTSSPIAATGSGARSATPA
jgi:hypothetical protein